MAGEAAQHRADRRAPDSPVVTFNATSGSSSGVNSPSVGQNELLAAVRRSSASSSSTQLPDDEAKSAAASRALALLTVTDVTLAAAAALATHVAVRAIEAEVTPEWSVSGAVAGACGTVAAAGIAVILWTCARLRPRQAATGIVAAQTVAWCMILASISIVAPRSYAYFAAIACMAPKISMLLSRLCLMPKLTAGSTLELSILAGGGTVIALGTATPAILLLPDETLVEHWVGLALLAVAGFAGAATSVAAVKQVRHLTSPARKLEPPLSADETAFVVASAMLAAPGSWCCRHSE